ncbi:hypothetical protein [Ferrimonas marina]
MSLPKSMPLTTEAVQAGCLCPDCLASELAKGVAQAKRAGEGN